MGMYTTIVDLLNREWQIKTGGDQCESYKVGQIVDWHIDPRCPGRGTLLDGVYWGCGDKGVAATVIIKRHVVHSVEVIPDGVDPDFAEISAKHQIRPYERSWWPAREWARLAKSKRRWKREQIRFNRRTEGMSFTQKTGLAIAQYTRKRMKEPSILRKIFDAMPIQMMMDPGKLGS